MTDSAIRLAIHKVPSSNLYGYVVGKPHPEHYVQLRLWV
jgi:hypothetical protein